MEALIRLLQSLAPMSPALIAHLRTIITLREYKRGETILAEGQVCDRIAYIESGAVHSYYILGRDKITNWVMREKDIFISVLSFHLRTGSIDIHVALRPCRCWGITFSELEDCFNRFPEFERHGRILESQYYCASENRAIFIKRNTPDAKYEWVMKEFPELDSWLTNKQLASYLGIRARTLTDARTTYLKKIGQHIPRKPRKKK
jgi:CRP-like cAMP-binding protein